MVEIASVIAGIFIAWYFYFLKIPIFVCLFVFIINGTLLLMKKKLPIYFIRSDLKVAIFCLPFWGLCTLLPGVQIKSMSNFIEPMILGGIWGLFLFVRLILVLCNVSKYKIISCCGNALVFLMCILFAYFFPSLPE